MTDALPAPQTSQPSGAQQPENDDRLSQVVEGIIRIAAGNLDTHIPVSKARDQVDAVITGINLLAGELNEVYADFEERVERRTRELREAHLTMQKMAMTDPLTGVGNRSSLHEALDVAISARIPGEPGPAVLMIDLDGFKDINDSFGHHAGDLVLIEIAARLVAAAGSESVVARLGGDEFAVLLQVSTSQQSRGAALRIMDALKRRIPMEDMDVWPRASIGIHLANAHESASDILLRADTAMYAAKEDVHRRIKVFEPVMLYSRQLRRETARELRRAVPDEELFLEYQPVVDLESGRLQGVEALVRWNHPRRGVVMPDDFIPLAEETGLIVGIGRWVMCAALEQLERWRPLLVSEENFLLRVNLAALELQSLDLVDFVRDSLRATRTKPGELVLEITESALLSGGDVETYSLRSLQALGVGLEIDDFGTGYSSISYLRRLPVDTVKVDRSLIADIAGDDGQLRFVDAVHNLIRAAGLEAVFEGIETAEQAEQLRKMGCCSGQGYYFSRPIPAGQITVLLQEGRTLPEAPVVLPEAAVVLR
ncbi:EAL domain-containing protein [Arthrobacter gengyunqii]|uniref:EAL domain-containing protein n=1 Tax=Arthrobacter gengyunqii TaxID=2886940 RepID=A0A9X1S5R2_9MICC|nr:EAL domain-containing protein [Arthrobacter gengyunqii]MCC3269680.1 EAL domain-containing protein [Arthrobacter gengyunqii]UOY97138.1 EAL domain-containing protein [Arthrobacter gengyunqii]